MTNPKWLDWARRLQALAQSGLTYTDNPFEIERYQQVRDIAAEILSDHTSIDFSVLQHLFTEQTGYATPKVDVRGVVFHEGRILLVKELCDGGWTLPGGWVDVNDAPSEAVEREVLEESGFEVQAIKLLALFDRNRHGHTPHIFHIYKTFFLCELLGGNARDSVETSGAAFFAEDAIPPLSIGRVTPEEIGLMFMHLRHPERPTDFD